MGAQIQVKEIMSSRTGSTGSGTTVETKIEMGEGIVYEHNSSRFGLENDRDLTRSKKV